MYFDFRLNITSQIIRQIKTATYALSVTLKPEERMPKRASRDTFKGGMNLPKLIVQNVTGQSGKKT